MIMNGARVISAIELHRISEYLHVSTDHLMRMPDKPMNINGLLSLMGRVKTEEDRKGIRLTDELSDMILFHARVRENGKNMEQPWGMSVDIKLYEIKQHKCWHEFTANYCFC